MSFENEAADQHTIMKFFKYCLLFSLLLLFSCDKEGDQEPADPFSFTEAQILQVHNGDQKEWRLSEFYESYSDQVKSDQESCVTDDIYTFFANDRVATVAYGAQSCYWDMPTAQFGGATYTYYPESGNMFLDFSIAEQHDAFTSAEIWIMKLIELTPNRMVFANGSDDKPARAIVFETN